MESPIERMPKLKPDLERVFQSSNLLRGSYSPTTRTLTIEFGNGQKYRYAAPPEVWKQLTDAKSPGTFFHQIIKPNFPALPNREEEKEK